MVTTLIAAYLPARRASRISPVAAMRDDVALPESSLRRRMIVGLVLLLLGIAAAVLGLPRLRWHRSARSSASARWRS